MTVPKNHQYFEVIAADILTRAYEEFPAVIHIDSEADFDELWRKKIMPDHCTSVYSEARGSAFTNTARFLKREGLIHFSDSFPQSVENVTLTSKGFTLLRSSGESIQNGDIQTTFAEYLKMGLKKVGNISLSATISALIKSLLS